MFEFLDKMPIAEVTSAVYYAVRTLRHLKNVEVENLESEKYIGEKETGLSIISSIVDKEGKLLSDFDSKTRERYINELYYYLDNRNQNSIKHSLHLEVDHLRKWRNESVHSYEKKDYNLNYSKKVFISYNESGYNILELKRILDLAKISIVEWKSKSDISLQNFVESIPSVSFAVFIVTSLNNDVPNANLLFELGYLSGKLGRDKILLFIDAEVKLPSILAGFTYLDQSTKNWKFEFIKRLDYSGIQFDKQALDEII
jgi:hypothetical protein